MKILVTGGASGLGEAIVRRLAAAGEHSVLFTYANSAAAAKEITSSLSNTSSVHCDFTDEASLAALLERMKEEQVDVLVNNALTGMTKDHFQKIDPAVFSSSFERNVLPTLRITQEAIRIFRKKKAGKIVTILSAANINKPPVGWSEYTANKAYLLSMSRSWATENIRFNITSNCISPAFMQTKLTADTDERMLEQIIDGHPLKKLLTAGEVADAVAFLATASSHVNGINMIMNAGNDIQ